MEHVMVWESVHGKVPDKHQVHHIDHDKLNNDISNLELLDWLTHKRKHSGCELRDDEDAENLNTLTLTINEKTASALGVENAQSPLQLKISVSDGKNFHSTVKPLALTKYLANLIKPPTGGRLLVPFSGSGSEMIGALQAGWEYVEGVELTEEYIPIAEARIEYWTRKEKVVQGALL